MFPTIVLAIHNLVHIINGTLGLFIFIYNKIANVHHNNTNNENQINIEQSN